MGVGVKRAGAIGQPPNPGRWPHHDEVGGLIGPLSWNADARGDTVVVEP
jgi:hypothetical protein